MYSSSFTDLPNASSVGSLNHATLSNCVRRSVVCIPNMSTFRAFRSFVCLSVFACTPVHSNSLTTSTDSLARIAGALTKQLSVLPLSKHVSHTCLTSSSSTRVFHNEKFRFCEEQTRTCATAQRPECQQARATRNLALPRLFFQAAGVTFLLPREGRRACLSVVCSLHFSLLSFFRAGFPGVVLSSHFGHPSGQLEWLCRISL